MNIQLNEEELQLVRIALRRYIRTTENPILAKELLRIYDLLYTKEMTL